jgi:hypothetical protein
MVLDVLTRTTRCALLSAECKGLHFGDRALRQLDLKIWDATRPDDAIREN